MLVRVANREVPDLKKQSDLGLHCLSRHFWQAMFNILKTL